MAKVPMQKVEIIAMASERKSILERLQRRGVMEFCDIEDDKLSKVNTSTSIAGFERSLSAAAAALGTLNSFAPEKSSLLASLNGRTPISTDAFAKKKTDNDRVFSMCRSINDSAKRIEEIKVSVARLNAQIDALKTWERLDIPQNFSGTRYTAAFLGAIPDIKSEEQLDAIFEGRGPANGVVVKLIDLSKGQACIAAICHRDDADGVYALLREAGFVPLQSSSRLTPSGEIEKLGAEIASLENEEEKCRETITGYKGKQRDIEFFCDYLNLRIDKYKALGELAVTQKTFVISGFVPERYVKGLVDEFESRYTAAITVSQPGEDEDVPVLLRNGKFSEPVEGITEMYALPDKRDVDPSPVMSFFYYLFFGMMLSDAGYGLVMFIVTSIILKKTTVEGKLRRSLTMFRNCGVSTVFWGVLFGSWFGDLPQIIASDFFGKTIKTTALWFEPLDDPIKLLMFSFGLGICHLFLGLAVNFHILWKEGKKWDAIFDTIPVYLTVLGVAPIAASILIDVDPRLSSIGKYVALAGVISILLTSGRSAKNIFMKFFGGFYGIYNVATGYLSDILSYSRLLALGLATGSIAGVINLVATMPSNPVVKAIGLIIVGLVGHTANIGVNLLGAYVHSDRLQFVELFSKFYEGGGRAFSPLKADTKYIKFDKENIYE